MYEIIVNDKVVTFANLNDLDTTYELGYVAAHEISHQLLGKVIHYIYDNGKTPDYYLSDEHYNGTFSNGTYHLFSNLNMEGHIVTNSADLKPSEKRPKYWSDKLRPAERIIDGHKKDILNMLEMYYSFITKGM